MSNNESKSEFSICKSRLLFGPPVTGVSDCETQVGVNLEYKAAANWTKRDYEYSHNIEMITGQSKVIESGTDYNMSLSDRSLIGQSAHAI